MRTKSHRKELGKELTNRSNRRIIGLPESFVCGAKQASSSSQHENGVHCYLISSRKLK